MSAHRQLTPQRRKLIDLAGTIDPNTNEEFKLQNAAIAVGYAALSARSNVHSKKFAWIKDLFNGRAEKVRAARQKGIEKGQAKAAEKKAFDVAARLIELAEMDPKATNNTIGGQVKACEHIAVMQGKLIKQTHELSAEDMKRSRPDKEFFAANGYWPEAAKKSEPAVN